MRRTRTILQAGALAAAAVLAIAAPAGAVAPPSRNLVTNGDEGADWSQTGYSVVALDGWVKDPVNAPVTRVAYGAPDFPTVAQAVKMGAGTSFFAGGPSTAADTGPAFSVPVIHQTVLIPPDVQQAFAGGDAQVTLSACLGGYANQTDDVSIEGGAHQYGDDRLPSDVSLFGPSAFDRSFQTKLLPASVTAPLPPGATIYTIAIRFHRAGGQGTYNDGYADKVELRLSPLGSTPPEADCTAPPSAGGPPAGQGGAVTPGTTPPSSLQSAANTAVALTQAARRILLTKRYALVRLRCGARDEACAGALTLRRAGAKLGSARFAIKVGRTATIKVKLGKTARRALARLSARRLARLKITATARIGAQRTTFTFGARR
jgi:hypothetical protein